MTVGGDSKNKSRVIVYEVPGCRQPSRGVLTWVGCSGSRGLCNPALCTRRQVPAGLRPLPLIALVIEIGIITTEMGLAIIPSGGQARLILPVVILTHNRPHGCWNTILTWWNRKRSCQMMSCLLKGMCEFLAIRAKRSSYTSLSYWDSPPIFVEDGLHFAQVQLNSPLLTWKFTRDCQTVDRLSRVWNYKKVGPSRRRLI